MVDGPKVFGIILVVLLALLGLGIYLYERSHGGSRRRRGREPERLPLFGTDQLAMRHGDELDVLDEPAPPPRRKPAPPLPRAERPREAPRRDPELVEARRPEPLRAESIRSEPPHVEPQRPTPPRVVAPPPPAAPPVEAPPVRAPAAAFTTGMTTEQMPAVSRRGPDASPSALGTAAPSMAPALSDVAFVEGETLRFTIPTDGTVEFLPGRLEVVAGPDTGKEIRFARAPGDTDIEVTFGRSEGPVNRHVQVLARTVSRQHAVMSLIDEHWQLTNLSTTNPLVLNGRVLAPNEVAPLLIEGDRVEMGEVVFIFHEG